MKTGGSNHQVFLVDYSFEYGDVKTKKTIFPLCVNCTPNKTEELNVTPNRNLLMLIRVCLCK